MNLDLNHTLSDGFEVPILVPARKFWKLASRSYRIAFRNYQYAIIHGPVEAVPPPWENLGPHEIVWRFAKIVMRPR